MRSNLNQSESKFLFNAQKKEFLDWLESLRISKYWLDTMSFAESFALCKEIYQVVKNFKQLELIEKEKLFALIEIDDCLQGVYEKLHLSYLDSKLPLNKEIEKTIQIVQRTYWELSKSYYGILVTNKTKKEISEQHLALAACKGFQALGVVFLTAAEIYTCPPQGFWLLTYRLFSVSEEANLLDNKVKIDNTIYSAAVLFKKIIIFYIIDKNQITPKEIDIVFNVLLKGINYIQSYILAMADINFAYATEIFGFSVNNDEPPAVQNNVSATTAKLLRYVGKAEVIKIIQFLISDEKQINQNENTANTELFSKIIVTLEYQKNQKNKRQTRISKHYSCSAVIGIDDLVTFLLEKEGKPPIVQNTEKLDRYEEELDSLTIIDDWETEKIADKHSIVVDNLKIIDSSMTGYGISWNHKILAKLQIGDAIGIIPDFNLAAKKIEIGLIKRIDNENGNIIFEVDLIGLESTLIHIERENDSTPNEWVLFLFGSHHFEVGILCHKQRNYQTGESIFVRLTEQKVPCRLGRLLNSTTLIDHIALAY
jgi:hypothetical protein